MLFNPPFDALFLALNSANLELRLLASFAACLLSFSARPGGTWRGESTATRALPPLDFNPGGLPFDLSHVFTV